MRCSTGAGMKAGAETRHIALTLEETRSRNRTGPRLHARLHARMMVLVGDAWRPSRHPDVHVRRIHGRGHPNIWPPRSWRGAHVFITAETTSRIDMSVHHADFLPDDTGYVNAALPPLIIDVDGGLTSTEAPRRRHCPPRW